MFFWLTVYKQRKQWVNPQAPTESYLQLYCFVRICLALGQQISHYFHAGACSGLFFAPPFLSRFRAPLSVTGVWTALAAACCGRPLTAGRPGPTLVSELLCLHSFTATAALLCPLPTSCSHTLWQQRLFNRHTGRSGALCVSALMGLVALIFELETGMLVASKVGNLPSKFGHARPLGSRIIR